MRITSAITALIAYAASTCNAQLNLTNPNVSRQTLSSVFTPPQVWKNVNLVRTINLEKGYPRETINAVIENVGTTQQDEYYLPFGSGVVDKVGSIEARDKKDAAKPPFEAELVEYDSNSVTQYYRIRLSAPLAPAEQQTITISFATLSSLTPLPEKILMTEKQYLQYTFSSYMSSAYTTLKQKTKVKFPSADVTDYTILPGVNSENAEDPQRQGSTFTYGPYGEVPAGAAEAVSVRYEFTKPVNHVTLLERDIEVSHWGGNLAIEERYWLANRAAALKEQFSRVAWASSQYYNPPTVALKMLSLPLAVGSLNPYFVDDIGNVSTSRFRSNSREAMLELKPRYPVFGDWKYKFKVGWDQDLKTALRKFGGGNSYILRVPFLEGPKQSEGVEYEKVQLRIILPEGATNVQFETHVPVVSSSTSSHRTFMDTQGRTMLTITATKLIDELRDRDLVITYDYPVLAAFRKPITIVLACFSIFAAASLLSRVDVSIGKR